MFPIMSAGNPITGYNINNSLRFRSGSSTYLSRTPASAGNRQIFTVSAWVKRGTLGVDQKIFSAYGGTSDDSGVFDVRFSSADVLYIGNWNTGLTTTAVFRDPSSWYHIVVAVDTTQATGSNRIKAYVNGVQYTLNGTAFVQNVTTPWNNSVQQNIGRNATASNTYFDGYIAEFYNIDGQALTPSSFGATDTVTGQWLPKQYVGTYGTNGFYLPFSQNTTSNYAVYTADASANYHSLPTGSQGTNFTFSGDFTVEGWVLYSTNVADQSFYVSNSGTSYFALNIDMTTSGSASSNNYTVYCNSSTPTATIAHGITVGNWTHVAMVRSGSTITLYTNGVARGSFTNSGTLGYSSLTINRFGGGSSGARYLSNVRITKSAVYTANFVPPTTALTNISNTVVLTYQNSTAVDNSSNAYTLTATGSPSMLGGNIIFNANIISDASGNKNNWIPNNFNYSFYGTTYDAMLDVPTLTSTTVANYATLNPLKMPAPASVAYSNGNLTVSVATANQTPALATIYPSSGKWYWEVIWTSGSYARIGVQNTTVASTDFAADVYGWRWENNTGNIYNGSTLATVSTYATNDVLGFCLDCDAGKLYVSKNGTWQNSAVPASGTGAVATNIPTGTMMSPAVATGSGTSVFSLNFGQQPFSYTPPTGFVALNTYNLPTPTIKKGNQYMDATTYTGNGSTQTITNAGGFQPDLVWSKSRSNLDTNSNMWVNSVVGRTGSLSSNQTSNEGTSPTNYDLVSFNSNGFTVGPASQGDFNTNAWTFIGWQWKAGAGTTSSNTNGSTTSTVSVNTTSGFSIMTWTGTGSNATIGHGLGVAPKMVIFRPRTVTGGSDWATYHASTTNANYIVFLNNNKAQTSYPTIFGGTAPTSTVFTAGSGYNGSGLGMVGFAWAEVAGYSKFGSYTGNGSTDGSFIYLGFRPKFIMIKVISTTGSWVILDSSRGSYNVNNLSLYPDLSAAEESGVMGADFLSNGFKLRYTPTEINGSGATYIYAAFAENPFKYANAR